MNALEKSLILIIAVTFFTLANSPGFAQESFKLSDYKNPDYSYRMLDFDFDLNGINFLNNESLNNDLYTSNAFSDLNASLGSTYNARKNTRRYQGYQMAQLGITPTWRRDRETDESPVLKEHTTKTGSYSIHFITYSTNRFYNQKQQFVELGYSFQSTNSFFTENHETTLKTYPFMHKNSHQYHTISASLPVMIGIGRIEEVQDARLAVYILDDLVKSGDLVRNPDANEILELAHFITSIKNKRYFDQRLRHISEITAVDSLLNVMGLKGKSGASYYTLLNDNWSHSAGPVRSSGSRLSFGFSPSFNLTSNSQLVYYIDSLANQAQLTDYKNELNETLTVKGLNILASYSIAKPINLFWQNSAFFSARYRFSKEEDKLKSLDRGVVMIDETLEENKQGLHISASNSVGYYPNSRTSIRLGAFASYTHNFFEYPEDENEAYSFIPSFVLTGINAYADYYVSPRLRFNISLSSTARFETEKSKYMGLEAEEKIQRNSLSTSLMAGFVYSVF